MAANWRLRVIGGITFALWTYVIVKGIALRIPLTSFDRVAFFAALAFGLVHTFLYWADQKRKRIRDSITNAEPVAAPNGGPATQLGNSSVTEGPPSVS